MKHLFIPYELAVIAKEKGFNDKCFGKYYSDGEIQMMMNTEIKNPNQVLAPLYQQIVDWFREKHKLHIVVEFDQLRQKDIDEDIETYSFRINEQWSIGKDWFDYRYGFKHIKVQYKIESHYEALNKAIEESFKII